MLRKATDETDPGDWFLFAAERLKSADHLWAADGLTMTGIELLQEAVERYLKGFLIGKGWRLMKIHDLKRLVEEAIKFDSRFGPFQKFAVELTADFFAQHYPGNDLANVGTNYESFRQQTGEMIALIKQNLPQYFEKSENK